MKKTLLLAISICTAVLSVAQDSDGHYGVNPDHHSHYNCSDHMPAPNPTNGKTTAFTTTFVWPPLRQADGFEYFNTFSINNYVDQDPTSGIDDYNFGGNSYDTHKGTDLSLYPFAQNMQNDDQVEVIAAAAGTIVAWSDGNPDNHCDWLQPDPWNYIAIQHADGSIAFYGHMKNGSLQKSLGQPVAVGEKLGIVASSGRSSGPHLHFEVWTSGMAALIDPFAGPNNSSIVVSAWDNQPDYKPSALNYATTSSAQPEPWSPSCPTLEQKYEQYTWNPSDLIYFCRMYRHQKIGQTTTAYVKRPDGTTWQTFNNNFTSNFNQSWWYNSRTLPSTAPNGIWDFEINYDGETYIKKFEVTGSDYDCDNVQFGSAYTDSCGNCVGGTTGQLPCMQDCHGDWGGSAFFDSCGQCAGGNTGITPNLNPGSCITSVAAQSDIYSTSIFPNPAVNKVFITGIESDAVITIVSVSGAVIMTIDAVNQLDISNLISGYYIMSITTDRGHEYHRFMKP